MQHGKRVIDELRHRFVLEVFHSGQNVFFDAQVRKDHASLWDIGHASSHTLIAFLAQHGSAIQHDLPAARRQYTYQGLQQRAFPHSIAAHDGNGFSVANAESNVTNDVAVRVIDVQVANFKHYFRLVHRHSTARISAQTRSTRAEIGAKIQEHRSRAV